MTRQKCVRRTPRRKLAAGAAVVCLGLALCAAGAAPCAGQEGAGVFVSRLPARLPLKAAVRNPELLDDLKNERLLRDLEVEITNTGGRPIYFVSVLLHLSGARVGGLQPMYKLSYGSPELGSFNALARAGDVPLAPGESAVLKVPDATAEAWEKWKARGVATDPRKLVLVLHQLNFGDGTGFVGPDGKQMPNPNAGRGWRAAPRKRVR